MLSVLTAVLQDYVQGFPTVVFFKNGNKTFEHPGLRKEPDIMKFMKDPKEPPAPAPEEASWSEQVPNYCEQVSSVLQNVRPD